MAKSRKDSLLQFPGVTLHRLQHVAAVVRFDDDGGATAQLLRNQRRNMAKIHQRRDLHTVVRCRETKIIDRVVRHRERVKVDRADAKVLT